MSERKVLNKYYPPDFDPSKIPKGKRNKNAVFNIRIMAPFNMRCNMCKEYIYKGKKFNSRKEDVMDETYLGLRIFRFYIKCPRCVSEIAFKTDLENTDYTLEAGATRLFEAEKLAMKMAEQERKEKEDDEMNPMTMLENRTKASRQEMDQIDSLEELREMNSRKNIVNTDEMIAKYRKYEELLQQLQIEKEEQEIKDIFGEKGGQLVKRLHNSDSEDEGAPEAKKPLVTTATNPTDILAQEVKEVKTKTPQSWEKSVGSLSSKNQLKGLVVKKKSSALSSLASGIQKGVSSQGQDGSVNISTHQGQGVKSAVSVGTSEKSDNINKETTAKEDTSASDDCCTTDKVMKQPDTSFNGMEEQKKDLVSTEVNKDPQPMKSGGLGSLGLLGANYSDSESDTSDG